MCVYVCVSESACDYECMCVGVCVYCTHCLCVGGMVYVGRGRENVVCVCFHECVCVRSCAHISVNLYMRQVCEAGWLS